MRPHVRSRRDPIPRLTLQARHQSVEYDVTNYPIGETTIPYDLENCTIQPATGGALLSLPEGMRDREVYKVLTSTSPSLVQEGGSALYDEVFIPSPYTTTASWFLIVEKASCNVGLIPHYELLVVKGDV